MTAKRRCLPPQSGIRLTNDFLAAKLPTVGSFNDVRRYENGTPILGGVYELTTQVTRVA